MKSKEIVYVVDDDAAMRDSLEFLLLSAGFEARCFESAEAFLAAARDDGSACVVSDVRMPGKSGVELLEHLKRDGDRCPVILMTGHGDVPLAVEAMKRGAVDFVEKPFDDERLIGAIRAALAQGAKEYPAPPVEPEIAARVESLSRRERQVMEGLVAGLSNKTIARDHGISPRTVEVYRANVMGKMQAGSLSELVRLGIRAGVLKS